MPKTSETPSWPKPPVGCLCFFDLFGSKAEEVGNCAVAVGVGLRVSC